MISISTTSANPEGNVLINTHADFRENEARINRYSTLDGGVATIHGGVSDGDRTLSLSAKLNKTEMDKLWTIFNNETFILLSMSNGVYLASIKILRLNHGSFKSTIYINNKES